MVFFPDAERLSALDWKAQLLVDLTVVFAQTPVS